MKLQKQNWALGSQLLLIVCYKNNNSNIILLFRNVNEIKYASTIKCGKW